MHIYTQRLYCTNCHTESHPDFKPTSCHHRDCEDTKLQHKLCCISFFQSILYCTILSSAFLRCLVTFCVLRLNPSDIFTLLGWLHQVRAQRMGLQQAMLPLVQAIQSMATGPVLERHVSPGKYRNLARYLGKLTCRKMIKTAFSFAHLGEDAFNAVRHQLTLVMFAPTI